MQTRPLILRQHTRLVDDEFTPVVSWRGIFAGLWLTSTLVIVVSLLPGIGLSLGNLPGDIDAGSQGGGVRVPIATVTLVLVTLAGIYYRISSYLSRH